ncbi:MAG: C2 family cysteine protease [Planctomycetota bacterium]|nr:C2 family cysteine protease [Planctomycetota bacterium]
MTMRANSGMLSRLLGLQAEGDSSAATGGMESLESRAMLSAGYRFSSEAPAVPASLAAQALTPFSVALAWSRSNNATGYSVLRSELSGSFTEIARVTSANQLTFTDSTATNNHAYRYTVAAIAGSAVSAAARSVMVVTPLVAPAEFSARIAGAGIELNWQGLDSTATGYIIVRSVDGAGHKPLVMLHDRTLSAFADTTAISGTVYTYRIQAMGGTQMSALTSAPSVAMPLTAPRDVNASAGDTSITVSWTGIDERATGVTISRSAAGGAFQSIGIVSKATMRYTDSTATAGVNYQYRIEATRPGVPAGISSAASATIVAAGPAPSTVAVPGIAITTRYGNELVITASSGTAPIKVAKSGANLRITSGDRLISEIAMPGSLFVYDRGGTHAIAIDATVNIRTTVSSLGGGTTSVTSAASNVSVWIDSTDAFTGTGTAHRISTLAGNVSKAAGISLPNPTDSGRTVDTNASLWGRGPVAADVNQGAVGDCYLLSSFAAFAVSKPSVLLESAVDLGDGTYLVQFIRDTTPVYVRVSNDIPSTYGTSYNFARPGVSGTVWAPVMEKAFAYFRTGQNTYASISGGWMGDAYRALGVRPSTITLGGTADAFFSMVSSAFNSGKAITFGTSSTAPSLVRGHAYTLVGVTRDSSGIARYTVRNPWGASGSSIENSTGIATLTFDQMRTNFAVGAMAA